MSRVSERLLNRLDYAEIVRRRVENYRELAQMLDPGVASVFSTLPDGVCPLFFPVFVRDKHAAAEALRARGVDALEFWNESSDTGREMSANARYFRQHVLELPIHQDLTRRHIAHIARHVSALGLRMAA
jgi:hypothetical protein